MMTDKASMCATKKTPWQVVVSRAVAEPNVRVERARSYGPTSRHVYNLYEPPTGQPVIATALFIYGGSWETGERGCYAFVGAALATKGVRTIIADYRLHPQVSFPGFVEDMALAYAHTAKHYAHNGQPPVLVGHSAGAHIAALLAGDRRYLHDVGAGDQRPNVFIGLSGPYVFDPTTWDTTKHIFAPVKATPDLARPIAFAAPDFPKTLLLHGGRDTLVTPNASTLFHKALVEAGADATVKVYRHLAHAGPIVTFARPLRWLAPTLKDVVGAIQVNVPQPSTPTRQPTAARTAKTEASA